MIQPAQFLNQNGLLVTPWTSADQTAVVCLVVGGVPVVLWLRGQVRAWSQGRFERANLLQFVALGVWVLATALLAAAVISVVVPPAMPEDEAWFAWQRPLLHPVIGYLVAAATLTAINALLLRASLASNEFGDASLTS